MKRFVSSTKQKYRERRGLNRAETQWPICKAEKLVKLVIVEHEQGHGYNHVNKESYKHTPLAYADLFKAGQNRTSPVRKILLEGDAGIGKTTFCTAISEDWANANLFQQFELLILLPLRQRKVALASSIAQLLELFHPLNKEDCDSIADYWKKNQEKVLVIADGWDELSETGREKESFLHELLFGDAYSLMSVLVTSRPSASASFHELSCVDRFVEVHGFGEDDIKEYVQSEFADDKVKARGLIEQLKSNPLVESVCSIPLNCAIVCHLWRHLEEVLPSTLTELYTNIVLNVIWRNINKTSPCKALNKFDDLPESLQQAWWLLCELAFRALEKDKIVFSGEEISTILPQGLTALDEKIYCFGLLQSADSILKVGHGLSFHFLHLTFQEYLSALYLTRQPPATYLELLHTKTKRFAVVWRFLFGMHKLDYFEISPNVNKLLIDSKIDGLSLCHCALEARDTDASYKMVSNLQNKLKNGMYVGGLRPRSEYDCAAVIYVIDNTQECSGLRIDFRDCGVGEKLITVLTDALARKHNKLQVKELDLSGSKITDKGMADLFHKAPASFNSLERLNLGKNNIGADSINSLAAALAKSKSLQLDLRGLMLKMYDNPLGLDGLQALQSVICSCRIGMLNLAGSLTSDADANAKLLLALENNCHSLWDLDLSRNNLGVPGASALKRVLPQLKKKTSLHLNECKLGNEGMAALTQGVEGTCHLKSLQLRNNGINAAGISYLTDSICAGKIVIIKGIFNTLLLADNPLGLEGAKVVMKMFSSKHFQARRVDLSGCELTTARDGYQSVTCVDLGQEICTPQCKSNTVQSLSLDNNYLNGECIHILAGFMYICPHLKSFDCCGCNITNNDLKQLLAWLSELNLQLNDLDTWNLRDNDINSDGVSAEIKNLSMFPKLKNIDVSKQIQRTESPKGECNN